MGIEALVEAIDELIAEEPAAHCDAAVRALSGTPTHPPRVRDHHCRRRLRHVGRLERRRSQERGGVGVDHVPFATCAGAPTAAPRPTPSPPPCRRAGLRRGRDHLCPSRHGGWPAAEGTDEALARDEALLVKQATRLRFEQFVRAAASWDQLADPDGTEDAAEARRARRDVYLEASISGMYLGQMTLLTRSRARSSPTSWTGSKQPSSRPTGPAPKRSTARTRRSRTSGAPPRSDEPMLSSRWPSGHQSSRRATRPAPLRSSACSWTGRPCLVGSASLPTESLSRPASWSTWLSVADLERAVMEPSGRVEVSPKQRLFTGATRRAIELRDRECTHPFFVIRPRPGARPITSIPGAGAARRPKRTGDSSAAFTTACATGIPAAVGVTE